MTCHFSNDINLWNLLATNALRSFDLVPVTMASVNSSVLLVLLIATQRHPRMRKWPVLLCQGCSIWIDMICEGGDPKMIAIPQIPEHGKTVWIFGLWTLEVCPSRPKQNLPNKLEKWNWICDHHSKPSLVLNSAYIGNFEFRQCMSCSHLYRMHSIFTSIQITSFQHAGNSKNKGKWISHRLPWNHNKWEHKMMQSLKTASTSERIPQIFG